MNGNGDEHSLTRRTAYQGGGTALLPIVGAVFVAFLVIGMAVPVLPLHVHQTLELSTFVVGLGHSEQ